MSTDPDKSQAASEALALLELAVSESHTPVGELGDALARMSRALSECCKLVDNLRGAKPEELASAHIQFCHEMFEREVSVCIESLQFHDRMIQQLASAKRYLADRNMDSTLPDEERNVDTWNTRHAAEGSIELF
jgi:hypothetical protein